VSALGCWFVLTVASVASFAPALSFFSFRLQTFSFLGLKWFEGGLKGGVLGGRPYEAITSFSFLRRAIALSEVSPSLSAIYSWT
jgi:hypothetical protein